MAMIQKSSTKIDRLTMDERRDKLMGIMEKRILKNPDEWSKKRIEQEIEFINDEVAPTMFDWLPFVPYYWNSQKRRHLGRVFTSTLIGIGFLVLFYFKVLKWEHNFFWPTITLVYGITGLIDSWEKREQWWII